MALLRKGVLLPTKGVDFSQPSTFIDDRSGFPKNVRIYRGELRKRPGKSLYGSVITGGQVMGLGKLETFSESFLVRASKTNVQRYNTSISDWSDIGDIVFQGGDGDFFNFANIVESNMIAIVNGYNHPRKWTGGGNTAVLGGSPPIAKYACYLSPYLLLAYTNDGITTKPWGYDWCDTGNPEKWSGGNSGSGVTADDPSFIRNIMKLNEYAAIYKQDSIWLLQKVTTSDIFQPYCMKTGVGLIASRAVADAEGIHYFMGENDFYSFNGLRVDPIGKAVRDEVFERLDRDYVDRCFAIHVQELNEIWFYVVYSGTPWPQDIYKYNYRTGFWYYDTCDQITSALRWNKVVSADWDDDPNSWDSDLTIWDQGVDSPGFEEVIFGDAYGRTSKLDYSVADDNGVAVSASFVSKDFVADQFETRKRWLQLDIWAMGPAKLYVDYSVDYGVNWVNIPFSSSQSYLQLGTSYYQTGYGDPYTIYFDVLADHIRFRFRNAESGEIFYLRNFFPYYVAGSGIGR